MKKIFMATVVAAMTMMSACNNGAPKPGLKTSADTLSYELGMANSVDEEQLKMYLADPRTGSDTTYIKEFMKGFNEGLEAATDKKKAAYLAGLQVGAQMSANIKQVEGMVFAGDSTKHLSTKDFVAGFNDGIYGKKTALKINGELIDKQAASRDLEARIRTMSAAALSERYAADKKASDDFIAAKAKEAGVQKLPGGTLYVVKKAGTGEVAKEGQIVNVTYEGRLADGTVFDASSKHPGPDGQTIQMMVGQTIPGFDAALKAMPVGSTWELYIPYNQGYNEQSTGAIKPFSALVFTLTVVSIENTPQQ